MGDLWLKIKVWTKLTVVAAVITYAVAFVLKNSGQTITLWVWYNSEHSMSLLSVLTGTLLIGVIGTLLTRMMMKTVRQLRELYTKSKEARSQRGAVTMEEKAALLQRKPRASDEGTERRSDGGTAGGQGS